MWIDVIVEYIAGFLLGLLVFQSLFMRSMMGGTYGENVKRTFLPELLSMNTMMAGMAPVMIFLMMGRDMRAMWPGEPLFWFVMSLGVCVGFALAYPINVWLVAQKMKHGLMTVRPDQSHARAKNSSSHAEHGGDKSKPKKHAAKSSSHSGHGGMTSKKMASEAGEMGVTRAQLVAVTGFTLLMLFAGMFGPAAFVNLRLSAG